MKKKIYYWAAAGIGGDKTPGGANDVLLLEDGLFAFLYENGLDHIQLETAPQTWVLTSGTDEPMLDIDFVNDRAYQGGVANNYPTIASLLTCTRSTSGYYTNAAGTLTSLGTNLLLRSNTFGTSWSQFGLTNITGTTTGPDGVSGSATFLNEDTSNGNHGLAQQIAKSGSALTYTGSVYIKGGVGRTRVALVLYTGATGNGIYGLFDLANGTAGATSDRGGGGYTGAVTSIQSVGNGWYRCSLTAVTDTGITVNFGFIPDNGSGAAAQSISYTGEVGKGIYAYGAQLEQWGATSTYVATTTAASAAPLRYGTNGLLVEEARTNLLQHSDDFGNVYWTQNGPTITSDATTAPDGTATADLITCAATGFTIKSISGAISTTYTASAYFKAGTKNFGSVYIGGGGVNGSDSGFKINLTTGATTKIGSASVTATSETLANGWFRLAVTFTTSGADSDFDLLLNYAEVDGEGAGTLYMWGAQLEVGAFATSYIPTTSASVTRAADRVTAANVSWLNPGFGSIYFEGSSIDTGHFFDINTIANGEAARIHSYRDGSGLAVDIKNDAASTVAVFNGTFALGAYHKGTVAWANDNFASDTDGSAIQTDSSGLAPTAYDRCFFGGDYGGNAGIVSIKRFTYFPIRLSDSALAALNT